MKDKRLFVFGLGYSARVLANRLIGEGWQVAGTCQGEDKAAELVAAGIEAHLMDRGRPLGDFDGALGGARFVLSSVPPDGEGDPVLDLHGEDLARRAADLSWVGYLSTTAVYGDTGGELVDEAAPRRPTSARARRRVAAEDGWLALWRSHALPVHLFRLSGIYGPGSSPLDKVRQGRIHRIARPGHRFSRIHVEDIAEVLTASMARPNPGAAYNLADDVAAEPSAVTAHACSLLGVTPPPEVPFEDAARTMSAMALSFWNDNRLIDNRRIKDELGVRLNHPDYRSGLAAIHAAEQAR